MSESNGNGATGRGEQDLELVGVPPVQPSIEPGECPLPKTAPADLVAAAIDLAIAVERFGFVSAGSPAHMLALHQASIAAKEAHRGAESCPLCLASAARRAGIVVFNSAGEIERRHLAGEFAAVKGGAD